MQEYMDQTPQFGWDKTLPIGPYTGPSLPVLLAEARKRGAISQAAGDIGDVEKGMSPEFIAFMAEERTRLIADARQGGAFDFSSGDVHGYPSAYRQEFLAETEAKRESYGLGNDVEMLHFSTGRLAIEDLFYAAHELHDKEGRKGKPTIIFDPVSWAGLRSSIKKERLMGVYAPIERGKGLTLTSEGLRRAVNDIKEGGGDENPVMAYTIVPSNPTGEKTVGSELVELAKTAHEMKVTLVIDIIYLPISPDGIQTNSPVQFLKENVEPEVWANCIFVEGETKIVGTPRTASLMVPLPKQAKGPNVVGTEELRNKFLLDIARWAKQSQSCYPDPTSALAATALHRFPGGIHKAMGERYIALDTSRRVFQERIAALIPTVGEHSFYYFGALVDGQGQVIVREKDGTSVSDPIRASQVLLERHNLALAPGNMFRDGNHITGRFTAATTLDVIQKVAASIEQMLAESERHG